MTEKNDSLESKLKSKLTNSGSLSSADLGGFVAEEAEETKGYNDAAMSESTFVKQSDPGEHDGLNKAAEKTALSHITELAGESEIGKEDSLELTASDKSKFLDSIVGNERLELSFSLCNGKINLRIRNRTLPETQAIVTRIREELADGVVSSNLDYVTRIRSMLMGAQIANYNGTEFPTMDSFEPLLRTKTEDGDKEPGWIHCADHFSAMQEGIHTMLWSVVWEFEKKYWAMVEGAKQQDFWQPEVST